MRPFLSRILSSGATVALLLLAAATRDVRAQSEPADDIDYLRYPDNDVPVATPRRDGEDWRLRDETAPIEYELEITPFLGPDDDHFDASVRVVFVVRAEPVQEVIVNAQNISVTEWRILDGEMEVTKDEMEVDAEVEKIIFRVIEPLVAGKEYALEVKYAGTMFSDMRGFYKSYYLDESGHKVYLGTTHFGQMARRLLPCWDEPRFKARFSIIVNRLNEYNSISNARILRSDEGQTRTKDIYKPTGPISTYVLAIIVSNYKGRQTTDQNARSYGVWARPNAYDDTEYAFTIGPKLISAFDQWTSMGYYSFEGVDKMEMAAIPDFSAGAMENWGLLAYRESNILYNEKYTNTQQEQAIAMVIGHETAHMWFGDLVTCDWWSSTWLNEGFARYFQYIAVNEVYRDWDIMSIFLVQSMQPSMQMDASHNTHPLTKSSGIYTYADARTMFTTITYDKGGSILRMIQNIMGEGNFQAAIREYLKNNAYQTVEPHHLFLEFEKQVPDREITKIMAPWISQEGFPVLYVERQEDNLILTQDRFFTNEKNPNDGTRWNIPITIAVKPEDFNNPLNNLNIFHREYLDEYKLPLPKENFTYYVLNIQQKGYYRVNYDIDNWQAINSALHQVNHSGIHVLNRAQIVDDLFNLARPEILKYGLIFDILDYLKLEKDYLPWLAAFNGLNFLQQRIPSEEYAELFKDHVLSLLENIYDHLGFDQKWTDTHHDRLNRINVLNWACKYGHKGCVERALDEFAKVLDGGEEAEIDVNAKPAIYCTGLREHPDKWDDFWMRYNSTNYATEKAVIMTALGCSTDAENIHKLLDKILTEDIRPQDKSAAYTSAISGNVENVNHVLEYLTSDKWREWSKVMDLGSTLSSLASRFTSKEQNLKLETFITLNDRELGESTVNTLKAAVSTAAENLEWDTMRIDELAQFFISRRNSASILGYSGLLIAMSSVLYSFQ